MVKAKKNKKGKSDRLNQKKGKTNPFSSSGGAKKMNPFEVHVNKEKFNILGRTCKHGKGQPGVSRAKAVQKRKETLGKEFMQKNKSSEFKDRRIGRDSDVNDELLNARFVAEKMSQFKKASRFNLNDDEVLTHRGQTLEEIEQFHDNRSDDDMEDEDALDANFTEAAHFGGEDGRQDRKSAIEEMIAETKLRKAQSAKEKDEIFELTNKLDSNYKELIPLVAKINKKDDVKPKPDDYDRALREMVFEPRGAVSDRLKSEEELARIEKERLQNLENQRLARMQDEEVTTEKPNHRSADDLDDGYFAGSDGEEVGTLAYQLNGEPLSKNQSKDENDAEEDDDAADPSGAESAESDGEDDDVENSSRSEAGSDESEQDEAMEEGEEEEDEDDLSDFKDSDKESDTEETPKPKSKPISSKSVIDKSEPSITDSDLPFAIEMPATYEELKELLSKYNADKQGTLVERIIKCNHPKLEPRNKDQMNKLFAFLLQYINDLFTDSTTEDVANSFRIFDKLNPFLYDLMHMNPDKASLCLLDIIQEKYSEYKKNNKFYPSLETLVILKIVSNLYTTSDYRHNVVTPCYIFMSHVLSQARVRTRQDIAMGLFLVTLVLEYSQSSRRFIPSALNFLLGVIYLCIPKRPIEHLKIIPPFVSTGAFNKLLAIAEKPDTSTVTEDDNLLKGEDLVTTTISVDFKIRALNTTLRLIKDAIDGVSENIGANYLAEAFFPMLERIDYDIYPPFVKVSYDETMKTLLAVSEKPLKTLAAPEKKPKALRLLEPRIEAVYDDKRRPKTSKAKEEKIKLIHKIRRETKGAVREIRRDTQFLQTIRINQQIQSDRERKEKVKRIYMEASVQQGELNELSRQKKRKK